ncbi:FAD binding domain-containing protein [Pseudonocardia acaciae]|uniref:FAD binding domain-containing protein n=1 Tax=Pseudonocardia acaciae TaxID=551276 RepID=UPI00048C381F|nr:FAD binding domain-containing protein [Pseudonocardia acaciae]
MKPADFCYHRPREVDEAVQLLHELDDAKVMAGGQSLLPIMNMRLAEPAHVVDITAVAALRACDTDSSCARYGATTTHMMFEDELVPDVTDGLLGRAAAGIGYRAIRTRGTVGGSLAHSDSSAEWPTVLSALDAVVHVVSVRGARRIPVRELLLGFFSTALEPDELIVAVDVPRLGPDTRCGLYKLARKPGEFAESLAVALARPAGTELWLGAARATPTRLIHAESLLTGGGLPELPDLADAVLADTGVGGHPGQLHAVAVHRALRATEGTPDA